jgi:hypothetical protein
MTETRPRPAAPGAAPSPGEHPDVEMPPWYAHGRDLAATRFWPMARRLPG